MKPEISFLKTLEDVVNKITKHVELIDSEMKIYDENVSTTNDKLK